MGFSEALWGNVDTFIFLIILMGYVVSREAVEATKISLKNWKLLPNPSEEIKYYLELALSLRKYFKHFNQVTQGIFLLQIFINIPWVGFRLMDTLPGNKNVNASTMYSEVADVIFKINSWIVYFFLGTELYLAAGIKKHVIHMLHVFGDLFVKFCKVQYVGT